jgi:hypothetical protein
MSGHPHADMTVAAIAGVYAADQLMKGKEAKEDLDKNTNQHLVRAAIGAAVAIGALKMMQGDQEHAGSARESSEDNQQGHGNEVVIVGEHSDHGDSHSHSGSEEPSPKKKHHISRLVHDASRAYGLGRNITGKEHHGIVLLIAETLGALGLLGLED